jgi:hypothetical protein
MIDLKCPEVPGAIFNLALDDADLTYSLRCEELWREVTCEVLDHRFLKRSHHNVGTYDQGCRGPLCRKALREHPRRKTPAGTTLQLREERIYDPVLEYFHVVIKHRVRVAQQNILKDLKEKLA